MSLSLLLLLKIVGSDEEMGVCTILEFLSPEFLGASGFRDIRRYPHGTRLEQSSVGGRVGAAQGRN